MRVKKLLATDDALDLQNDSLNDVRRTQAVRTLERFPSFRFVSTFRHDNNAAEALCPPEQTNGRTSLFLRSLINEIKVKKFQSSLIMDHQFSGASDGQMDEANSLIEFA